MIIVEVTLVIILGVLIALFVIPVVVLAIKKVLFKGCKHKIIEYIDNFSDRMDCKKCGKRF